MSEHGVVVAVATYRSKREAERGLVAAANHGTEHAPIAGTLVEKGADGQLTIDAHHGPAMDVVWHGLLPGAAITAISAPLGIRLLVPIVPAPAAWTGVAALVAHFWHDIPKHQLRRMSDLIEACQAAVVVVALDHAEDDVLNRLGDSAITLCAACTSADFEAAFSDDVRDTG
jgi:hypothetical protein